MITAVSTFWNNPYLAVYYKDLYEKYWKDEVDELLVCVHGDNIPVNNFIASLFPNSRITSQPVGEMGVALDYIYPFVKGDILVTVDSDCFIEKKGIITKYAEMIKNDEYGAIGTIGKSSRPLREGEKVANHFGLVRLNTFLSFWNKHYIDNLFGSTFQRMRFSKGEEFLGYKFTEQCKLDTMAYLTLKFIQNHKYKIMGEFEGVRHIGGLSHQKLGNNRKEIMDLIIKQTIDRVPKELRKVEYED
jgi:hypothetical protein